MESESSCEIACACRGFHCYRSKWTPKQNEILKIEIEESNLFDPYACAVVARTKSTLTKKMVVGHLPREISRFCKFYIEYGGELTSTVSDEKFRRSPIPQGGLEIPIKLRIFKGSAPNHVFQRMKELITTTYMKPYQIPPRGSTNEEEDVIEL